MSPPMGVTVSFVLLVVVVAACTRLVWTAGGQAGLEGPWRQRLAVGTAGGLAGWLGLTAALAALGFFRSFEVAPPRIALAALGASFVLVLLWRGATSTRLLEALPRSWPVAVQSFRLPLEWVLWQLFVAGALPRQMTFEGRNWDVLVGLSAPAVAWAVARGRLPLWGLVAWNVASLGLLANIVIIAMLSAPGPLRRFHEGIPNTLVAEVPYVWLPALLVPLALLGHVLSLRQCLRDAHRPRQVASPGPV